MARGGKNYFKDVLAPVASAKWWVPYIAKVLEWLGHANLSTIRLFDKREMRPEDSSTFKVAYSPMTLYFFRTASSSSAF